MLLTVSASVMAQSPPPRGLTPTPRVSPTPTRPAPTPPGPTPVLPSPTPSTPASTGYKWRITIEAWDDGNKAWAPPQTYEVTGEVSCRLLIDSPCGIRIERLAWNDDCWSPAWLRMDRKTLVFCDPDFGAGPIEKAPYWIPMPPPPVRDPRREAADAMTREAQERGEYDAEMDMAMPVTPLSMPPPPEESR